MDYQEFLKSMTYTSVKNMDVGQKELLEGFGYDLEPSWDQHVVGAYFTDDGSDIFAVQICEPNPRDCEEYEFIEATIERSIYQSPLEKKDDVFRKVYEFCQEEGLV